jgi:O-antigen ligase
MLRRSFHHMFHLCCLLSVAFLMPLSVWLVSFFSIAMIVNWIAGLNYSGKIKILWDRKELLIIPALFLLYVVWLLNTSDFVHAVNEFKLKLPLLVFPLMAGAYGTFSQERIRLLLLSFISGCVVAVAAGYCALAGILPGFINDSRDLALFVPSIRLSIMLNLAIFAALFMGLKKSTGSILLRVALIVAATAMTFFLFRLLSVTGLIIFVILSAGTGVYFIVIRKYRIIGASVAVISAAAIIIIIHGLGNAWNNLHQPAKTDINVILDTTPSGNSYSSFREETYLENGYLVWNNVCEKELRKEWNKRSRLSYDSTDIVGNELRVTLIRYISYLGMAKDSAAVVRLSDKDIQNIENGFANPLYADVGNPGAKWYEIAWQADRYLKGANPSGHSVTQRLEFYKASFAIIRRNMLTGVGTGDVRNEFDKEYATDGTPLTAGYRLMAHNQYLTLAITFGIPGMILALILLISPVIMARKRLNYLFVVFLAIIFVSMFNDDTFESVTGATYFSYFYTLFLLNENSKDDEC